MIKVQVNASNTIENKDSLERWASDHLNEQLGRFEADITSIEAQLSDQNHATRGGAVDKRCMLEARISGRSPLAVTHDAPDQNLAFRGATDKLAHALAHAFGKRDSQNHRERDTIRRDPDPVTSAEEGPQS